MERSVQDQVGYLSATDNSSISNDSRLLGIEVDSCRVGSVLGFDSLGVSSVKFSPYFDFNLRE